jgi:hypothetical protein
VLFDVLHGWVIDPVITDAKINERVECEGHIKYLKEELPHIAPKSIVLLDRGYPSQDLIEKFEESGIKFVMRVSSKFTTEVNAAPMGETTVACGNGIALRIIKFFLQNGETETLISNLSDIPACLFPELYSLRWGIETAYFTLKRELCVEKFSGKTVNSILQDFWASMILLIAVSVFQAAADSVVADRHNNKQLKHKYRARTSDLIITLRDRFIFATLCGVSAFADKELENVISLMAWAVSSIRPSRSFVRRHRPFCKTSQNLKSSL